MKKKLLIEIEGDEDELKAFQEYLLIKVSNPPISVNSIDCTEVMRQILNTLKKEVAPQENKIPRIVVQVLGGCVTSVHASEQMEVELIDHDNQSDDDEFDSDAYAEEQTKNLIEVL